MNEAIEMTPAQESAIEQQIELEKRSSQLSFARALGRVIFVSLLVTIALTAIPYGTVQPWWVALFECIIFSLGILGLVERLISKKSVGGASLAIPLVVLCLFMLFQSLSLFSARDDAGLISLSISADPYNTGLLAIKVFALVVTGLLLLTYASSKSRLRALIYVVIGVGVASALFGILRKSFQHGPGFFLPALPNDERGFAQFINRNHFAFLIAMSLGLIFGVVAAEIRHRRSFVLIPMAAVLWATLIYSNSRGGIVASLCQLLFLGLLLDPFRHIAKRHTGTIWNRVQNLVGGFALRAFLIVFIVVMFAYGVSWVGGEAVVNNFELAGIAFSQQGGIDREKTSRKEIWSSTWKLIKAHPVAGAGFGGYWIAITKYHDATGEFTPQEAHNDYLELLASGGIIGCALVAWFVVAFLKRARENLRSSDPYRRALCLGALTGIFGVLIHSFVDFGLHVTINALIFCTLMVIAVCSSDERITAAESRT